jgi:hypothetical protein
MTSLVRTPTFMPPAVPETLPDDVKDYLHDYNAYVANVFQQLQLSLQGMITRKHAPILIPATTIDASHAKLNITAASAGTIFNQLALESTAASSSSTTQTAVSYTGRGVLNKVVVIEKTSGGTSAYNAAVKITIDDTAVYNQSAALNRQSQMRVILGNQLVTGTDLISVTKDPIGLPFNKSCKIEYSSSDGSTTTTVGWNIAKKL